MIKIDSTGYLPHVRNVFWENNGAIAKINMPQTELGKWLSAKILLKNNFIEGYINKDYFSFSLPTHSLVNTKLNIPKDELEEVPFEKITFRDYGSIGFRSAPAEEVYIRNLRVISEPLCCRIQSAVKLAFLA